MSKPIDINEVMAELEEDRKNGTLVTKVLGSNEAANAIHLADLWRGKYYDKVEELNEAERKLEEALNQLKKLKRR